MRGGSVWLLPHFMNPLFILSPSGYLSIDINPIYQNISSDWRKYARKITDLTRIRTKGNGERAGHQGSHRAAKSGADRGALPCGRRKRGKPYPEQPASGILEVMPDGFGFIRCENFLPGENDVYVSPTQIRRFNLKTGDIISGNRRVKTSNEKFAALLYIKNVNG